VVTWLHWSFWICRHSAPFDTVDRGILLQRLRVTFGFDDTLYQWFRSYLLGRTQHVRHELINCPFDVRCTSRVGARPYATNLMYCRPDFAIQGQRFVFTLICRRQACVSLLPTRRRSTLFRRKSLECVGVVSSWMRFDRFQLNSDKTEVLWSAPTPTTYRHIVDRRRSSHPGVIHQEPGDFH
jgi:hypothetical protein